MTSQKYSITPEGAKSAAEEVKLLCEQEVGEYLSKHKAIIKVSALQINVDFLAATILRHAEQSQKSQDFDAAMQADYAAACEMRHIDWDDWELAYNLGAKFRAASSEGEMREALKHAVMCMDRSCKRCNELQRELGPEGREEKP